MQQRLARDGITLIGEFARLPEDELVARYGKIGRRLHSFARGEDDRAVNPDRETKSISSEITLDADLADFDHLRPILWRLSEKVSRRLRRTALAGAGVTLKLKTAEFRLITRSHRLAQPSQSAEVLFRAAEPLLRRETDGRAFRLIGIGANGLSDVNVVAQADLFQGEATGDCKIESTLHRLQERFGEEAVIKGRGFGVRVSGQGPTKD